MFTIIRNSTETYQGVVQHWQTTYLFCPATNDVVTVSVDISRVADTTDPRYATWVTWQQSFPLSEFAPWWS